MNEPSITRAPVKSRASRRLPTAQRLSALDGLRGLAALIVLIHHALLIVPALAAKYYDGNPLGGVEAIDWWLTYTPLHLFWEGTAAVYVFFILSGLVLTLPVLRTLKFSWTAYFPHRVLRLYLPVWAAVSFAVLTLVLVPRVGQMSSDWLDARTREASVAAFIKDATLVFGAGGLASPLWSLRWEVIFSLLLPAFVWMARKGTKHIIPCIAVSIALISLGGYLDRDFLRYMPMFMIGVLLATAMSRISALRDTLDEHRYSSTLWTALGISGILLLSSHWTAKLLGASSQFQDATIGLTTAGALIITLLAAFLRPMSRVLELAVFQKLGTISFSLYLIHEPIVIAFGYLLGPESTATAVALSIPAALLLAQLFYYAVERPSHKLAKWLQAWITARTSPSDEKVSSSISV